MQYRVFAVPATGAPDLEGDLNQFLRSHKVISVQKALESVDGVPRWCFCIEYLDGKPSSDGKSSASERRIDYKEVLSDEDFAVFARLREIRKEIAASEAVPAYAICTNEQLAAVATRRPTSLAALKKIDGLGEAKAAKYGAALLRGVPVSPEGTNEESRQLD